jgi:predicted RNA-binding Zn-ribbon protein involved in translation (DUF1610 family)
VSTEPLSFEQLDQMRRALADLEVVDNGLTGVKGRYGWSDRGVSKTVNMLADLSLLLAEVERLRELKCETCGMRVAHLNCNGYVIGWGCADGEKCEPASGMPHTPAQGEAEYHCPNCYRWAPWTDGVVDGDDEGVAEFWCQTCGCQTAVEDMESRPAPSMPVPAAQPGAGDAQPSGTGSGRGTEDA